MRGYFSKFSKEELIDILNLGNSVSAVLRNNGLATSGSSSRTSLRSSCEKHGILSMYNELKSQGIHRANGKRKRIPLDEMLTENSSYARVSIKRKLLSEGLIENICSICGLIGWQGEELTMILDHINGINNDHRLENLRMLCPNCNSQQSTFSGKNNKKLI